MFSSLCKSKAAEDGSTIKNYFIHVTRLSASDASLSELKLSIGLLSPNFASNITSYSTFVPFSCSSVEITPAVADKKTAELFSVWNPYQLYQRHISSASLVKKLHRCVQRSVWVSAFLCLSWHECLRLVAPENEPFQDSPPRLLRVEGCGRICQLDW